MRIGVVVEEVGHLDFAGDQRKPRYVLFGRDLIGAILDGLLFAAEAEKERTRRALIMEKIAATALMAHSPAGARRWSW